jgi:hypothetical protein
MRMHSHHKLLLQWFEFATAEWFTHTKDKAIFKIILLVLPLWGWSPWNWAEASNYITVLSAHHCESIWLTITDIMESLRREVMLRGPVEELDIVYLLLKQLLNIVNAIFKQTSNDMLSIFSKFYLYFFQRLIIIRNNLNAVLHFILKNIVIKR